MILPSEKVAISFAGELLLSEVKKRLCCETVMVSDESSDEVPQGIGWDAWHEATRRHRFSHKVKTKSIPSDVAAMPYQKAICYGYYPSYEVNSMQLIKCKVCGMLLKDVGYGHHLQERHGRSKSPPLVDDCQTFLLSPPHIGSPRQSDASDPSFSFLKASASSSTTNCDDLERSFSHIISPQYSIEQRDELKLALKMSRRDLSQVPGPSTSSVKHVPSDSVLTKPGVRIVDGEGKSLVSRSRRRVLNGRLKSKKKKKKRSGSTSSDDFSLDHIRNARRSDELKQYSSRLIHSASAFPLGDPCTALGEASAAGEAENSSAGLSSHASFLTDESASKDTEGRDSESPEILLVDLLRPSTKAAAQSSNPTSVRTRLRSFANASLKRSYPDSTQDEVTVIREIKRRPILSCASSPQLPSQTYPDEETSMEATDMSKMNTSTSSVPVVTEDEKPFFVKQEVQPVWPNSVSAREPLVVEACGSNTFILSSKFRKQSSEKPAVEAESLANKFQSSYYEELNRDSKVNAPLEVKHEEVYSSPIHYQNGTYFTQTAPSHTPQTIYRFGEPKMSTSTIVYRTAYDLSNQSLPVDAGKQKIIKQKNDYEAYDAVVNGAFDSPNDGYESESCSYRDSVILNGHTMNLARSGHSGSSSVLQSYLSEEDLDLPKESEEMSSSMCYEQASDSSNLFSNIVTLRNHYGGNITVREKGKNENLSFARGVSAEKHLQNRWSRPLRTAAARKSYHCVYRVPQSSAGQLSSFPKRRIIFAQRKHEENRYANVRLAVAKVLGTRLEYPEFQKTAPPCITSEAVQNDPLASLLRDGTVSPTVNHDGSSESPNDLAGAYQDPYYVSVSPANSSFSLRVRDGCTPGAGTSVDCAEPMRKVNSGSHLANGDVVTSCAPDLTRRLQNSNSLSRISYVSASSLGKSNYNSTPQLYQIVSSMERQRPLPLYVSTESASSNSVPPSLSPQQSPYQDFQSTSQASDVEPNQSSTSELESLPQRVNYYDANLNGTSTVGHYVRQMSFRRPHDAPPILKRMHTITTEPLPRRDSAPARDFSPVSGSVRRISRQLVDQRFAAETAHFQNSGGTSAETFENNNFQIVLPNTSMAMRDANTMYQSNNVYRVVSPTVSAVRPSILANGTRRYRVYPSSKPVPAEEALVFGEAPSPAYRPASSSAFVDPRSNVRYVQENTLHGTTVSNMRVSQRQVSVVPILGRYSASSPRLNGLTGFYNSSSPSLQSSSSSTCVSAVLPKTRMC